jgi:hypothetical protein
MDDPRGKRIVLVIGYSDGGERVADVFNDDWDHGRGPQKYTAIPFWLEAAYGGHGLAIQYSTNAPSYLGSSETFGENSCGGPNGIIGPCVHTDPLTVFDMIE